MLNHFFSRTGRAQNLVFCCILILFRAASGGAAEAACVVDFYFTPACEQCRRVEENTLPQLREVFGSAVIVRKHNLYDPAEFAAAMGLLAGLNAKAEDNVFCIIDGRVCLAGVAQIDAELFPVVEARLRLSASPPRAALRQPDWLEKNAFPFSFLTILAAGLVDGLNPCAFAAIIFLVSVLLAGRGAKKRFLWTGAGFCLAVYLTYFLIGLGLFQAFRLSLARMWLNNVLRGLLAALLLAMAALSFRDAWRFHASGRHGELALRLPARITRLIRYFIRDNIPQGYFMAGGFLIGSVVTALESICTGQLYVPTLLFLAKMSTFKLKAVWLLALYNLMFVLPLIAVFALSYRGVNSPVLISWNRKNVLWAKCLLGVFFMLLAIVLGFI